MQKYGGKLLVDLFLPVVEDMVVPDREGLNVSNQLRFPELIYVSSSAKALRYTREDSAAFTTAGRSASDPPCRIRMTSAQVCLLLVIW